MAIIRCPECGSEVSDKARVCPRCGCPIAGVVGDSAPSITATTEPDTEPGTAEPDIEVPVATDTTTPGEPRPDASIPDPAEPGHPDDGQVTAEAGSAGATGEAEARRRKKLVIGIVVGALIIAAIIAVCLHAQSSAKETYNDYVDRLESVKSEMSTGDVAAEKLSNTTKQVWYNAIFEHRRSDWNENLRHYYSTDFNTAVGLYFDSSEAKGYLETIETSQARVKALMHGLEDPPEELEDAYEAASDAYDLFMSFTGLAASPTGNITSFSEGVNEGDSDLADALDELDEEIPPKK